MSAHDVVPVLELELERLRTENMLLRQHHSTFCPGCELCLPGSDYMRNRPNPEWDLGPNGIPLRPGS